MRLTSNLSLSVAVAAIFVGGYGFKIAGLANLAIAIAWLSVVASILVAVIVLWLASDKDTDRIAVIRNSTRYPGWKFCLTVSRASSIASAICAIYFGAILTGILLLTAVIVDWVAREVMDVYWNGIEQ